MRYDHQLKMHVSDTGQRVSYSVEGKIEGLLSNQFYIGCILKEE
jgi:hypothetical protein